MWSHRGSGPYNNYEKAICIQYATVCVSPGCVGWWAVKEPLTRLNHTIRDLLFWLKILSPVKLLKQKKNNPCEDWHGQPYEYFKTFPESKFWYLWLGPNWTAWVRERTDSVKKVEMGEGKTEKGPLAMGEGWKTEKDRLHLFLSLTLLDRYLSGIYFVDRSTVLRAGEEKSHTLW